MSVETGWRNYLSYFLWRYPTVWGLTVVSGSVSNISPEWRLLSQGLHGDTCQRLWRCLNNSVSLKITGSEVIKCSWEDHFKTPGPRLQPFLSWCEGGQVSAFVCGLGQHPFLVFSTVVFLQTLAASSILALRSFSDVWWKNTDINEVRDICTWPGEGD